MQKKSKLPRSNREIQAEKVRLVDSQGQMVGVVNITEALSRAREESLDLVEVSPNAVPPVCKIIDFGKYKYELQKKNHEARKKQKTIELKEIKIRPNIGEHDYQIKLKAILKFLANGDKVKVSMRFRGREFFKQDIALNIMNQVKEATAQVATVESEPSLEARQLLMILAPTT